MAAVLTFNTPAPAVSALRGQAGYHPLVVTTGRIAFDDSYPTGGESVDLSNVLKHVLGVAFMGAKSGYLFEADLTAGAAAVKVLVRTPVNVQAVHTHAATTKVMRAFYSGGDVKGGADTNSPNADLASEPTNGHAVAAFATVAGGTWACGAITHPDRPRNVCVTVYNDSGGPLNLFEGVMAFLVTGTYHGAAQTETVSITSTAGNKAVATTKYRVQYGIKAFSTVTSITLNNVPADGLKIGAGPGTHFGLPLDLATPAEADVLDFAVTAVRKAVTGCVDTANNTVNVEAIADAADFEVTYLAVAYVSAVATGGAIAAAVAAEVADTTNLSTLAVGFVAWGLPPV